MFEIWKRFFKEHFEKILTYKRRNFFDTSHSLERFLERVPDGTRADYEKSVRQAIDLLLNRFMDKKGFYIAISQKDGYGIQMEWRPDSATEDSTNHGFSATTLGKDQMKFFKQDETKILIEKYNRKYKESVTSFADIPYAKISDSSDIDDAGAYMLYVDAGVVKTTYTILEVE